MHAWRALPYVAVVLIAWWGVATTHPPVPIAPVAAAPVLTVVPPLPVLSSGSAVEEAVVDTRTGARLRLDPVRDNRGLPWFARNGDAVWTKTREGLALLALDGQLLERIPGATDIRETQDGTARAFRRGDDWYATSPRGQRRLLGPVLYPTMSPDGRYFAFELMNGRTRDLHVVDLHSGEEIEVASGIGRCHCTSPDSYGYAEWATRGAAIVFQDHGDFLAPPEEAERPATFVYDLSTRRLIRTEQPPTLGQSPRCGAAATLSSPDGSHRLDFVRVCGVPRPPNSAVGP